MKKYFQFKLHRLSLIFGVLFSTVGCDQVTKVVARDSLQFTGPHNYFYQMLTLEFAQNSGGFLSLGAFLPAQIRFFVFTLAVALSLALVFIYLLKNSKINKWQVVGLSLILSGGIGNLIDRALRGWVIDFINMGVGNLRTGIFNVADIAISLGFMILLVVSLKSKRC